MTNPPLTLPPHPIHLPMMRAGIIHTENPARENLVCMWKVKLSGQIFSDQTGRFPIVYRRGKRSVMVLYDYYINVILTEPFKNNTTPELVRAQKRLMQYLLGWGLKPTALCIDNECPEALKNIPGQTASTSRCAHQTNTAPIKHRRPLTHRSATS